MSVLNLGLHVLAWSVALASQQPVVDGEQHAFVELDVPRTSYFVGEPIHARLRLGFEAQFLERNLVPLFQRALDVPVQVQWTSSIDGTTAMVVTPNEGPATRTFVFDESVVRGTVSESSASSGARYSVLEVERTFSPQRAGRLILPAPTLRFAYATEFREDFVHGRVAVDRREARITGAPFEIEVSPLPTEGRLEGFTGAIGRFDIEAAANTRELAVGEVLEITLRWSGDGNLADFPPPSLHDIDQFRLLGFAEQKLAHERLITYDFVPTSTHPREFPALPFVFFDPTPPAGYSTLWTKPIPLTIRAAAAAPVAPTDREPARAPGIPAAGTAMFLAGASIIAALAAIALVIWLALRKRSAAN